MHTHRVGGEGQSEGERGKERINTGSTLQNRRLKGKQYLTMRFDLVPSVHP